MTTAHNDQACAKRTGADRRDHYQEVTDRIVAALEAGTRPWRQPWAGDDAPSAAMPVNAATGRRYHGVNILVLAMSSFTCGGGDPRFCSYKQAAERGWQVRRGERGITVFFFKQLQVPDRDARPDAEERTRRIPVLRAYTVFNGEQIEGIPAYAPPPAAEMPWRRPEAADLILRRSGAEVRVGGDRAFYSPTLDVVQLPPEGRFENAQTWAATMLHELAHWSSAPNRLNRDIRSRFGSAGYAQEELRAELASAFIGAELGLPCDITGHASYVENWLDVLRQDKREIFRAAADAQRIADYLLGFHPDYARATAAGEPDDNDNDNDNDTAAEDHSRLSVAA